MNLCLIVLLRDHKKRKYEIDCTAFKSKTFFTFIDFLFLTEYKRVLCSRIVKMNVYQMLESMFNKKKHVKYDENLRKGYFTFFNCL
jgi:hypothetical protein